MKHESGEKPTPEQSLSTLSLNLSTFSSKSLLYKGKHKKCVEGILCLADLIVTLMRLLAPATPLLSGPVITAK